MAALEKHLKMMHQQRIAAAANIKAEQNKRIKLEQRESASSGQQSESGRGIEWNTRSLVYKGWLIRDGF